MLGSLYPPCGPSAILCSVNASSDTCEKCDASLKPLPVEGTYILSVKNLPCFIA